MIVSVYRRLLFDGAVQVTVFGAARNWNYAGATPSEIEAGNPGIIADLGTVIGALRIHRAFVPKPAFNARVIRASDLKNEVLPGFFRGADADGVIVERKGDAYLLASADCLTGVIYDPRSHRLAALHCGRNALLDRAALDGPRSDRTSPSSSLRSRSSTSPGETPATWVYSSAPASVPRPSRIRPPRPSKVPMGNLFPTSTAKPTSG